MKVGIAVFKDCSSSSVSIPFNILQSAGEFYNEKEGIPNSMFDISFISVSGGPMDLENGLSVNTLSINSKTNFDLIIISAIKPTYGIAHAVLENEALLIKWLGSQYEKGSQIASLCTGALLLASTGLLNGKSATTHWIIGDFFQSLFPNVDLKSDKIIIDEGRLYTCGGAMSATTFMIYLVEKFCGHDIALLTSKLFLIDYHKNPQSAYSIFKYQKDHNNSAILNIQEWLEKDYATHISLDEMALKANMSKRTFIRQFKEATSNTPLEYLHRVRVEAAKRALESSRVTINEICYDVGYLDTSTFREIFSRYTGVSPSVYKKQYQSMGELS